MLGAVVASKDLLTRVFENNRMIQQTHVASALAVECIIAHRRAQDGVEHFKAWLAGDVWTRTMEVPWNHYLYTVVITF